MFVGLLYSIFELLLSHGNVLLIMHVLPFQHQRLQSPQRVPLLPQAPLPHQTSVLRRMNDICSHFYALNTMHFLHTPSDQLQFVKGTRSLFHFISPKPVKPNIPSIDLLLFEFSVCSLEPITCFNIIPKSPILMF